METAASIRALSRDEVTEAMTSLEALEGLVGAMPYRDGVHAVALIETVRDTIGYCLPGGYAGECVGCAQSMGGEEIGVSDIENGGDLCLSCTPSEEEIAARQCEDGALGFGWHEWDGGGLCPVVKGTLVDIVRRDGSLKTRIPANVLGQGFAAPVFWKNTGEPSDIVRYRISPPTLADRSDGGLNILTRHTDIRNGAPRDI